MTWQLILGITEHLSLLLMSAGVLIIPPAKLFIPVWQNHEHLLLSLMDLETCSFLYWHLGLLRAGFAPAPPRLLSTYFLTAFGREKSTYIEEAVKQLCTFIQTGQVMEDFRALPPHHKLASQVEWWAFCVHSVSILLRNWGKERKALCSKWLRAHQVYNLYLSNPSALTSWFHFPFMHSLTCLFSLHTRTDLLSFLVVNQRVTWKCSGWFSVKWLFHCSASCALICPIHPNNMSYFD